MQSFRTERFDDMTIVYFREDEVDGLTFRDALSQLSHQHQLHVRGETKAFPRNQCQVPKRRAYHERTHQRKQISSILVFKSPQTIQAQCN